MAASLAISLSGPGGLKWYTPAMSRSGRKQGAYASLAVAMMGMPSPWLPAAAAFCLPRLARLLPSPGQQHGRRSAGRLVQYVQVALEMQPLYCRRLQDCDATTVLLESLAAHPQPLSACWPTCDELDDCRDCAVAL